MAAPTCTTEGHDDTELEFHCDSTSCDWWMCPDCAAVYDVERGVKVTRAGVVERL